MKKNSDNIIDENEKFNLELTIKEAKAILYCLSRAFCEGEELTISMKMEKK